MTHAERRERRRKMAAEVRGGEAVEAVAGKYGVTTSTVGGACVEFGVRYTSRRAFKRQFPKRFGRVKDTLRIAARLIATEENQSRIAERFGVSRAWVSLIYAELRALGVKMAKRHRWC